MDKNKNHSEDPLGLSKADLEALFEGSFNIDTEGTKKNTQNKAQNTPFLGASFDQEKRPYFSDQNQQSRSENLKPAKADGRPKSSLRIKYDAEVSSMIKTHGELEEIRRKLGLSKRKMAQLLMVDPSAWTRWTQKKGEAPPHIYRALEWFLLLQEKHPQYKASLWLNAVATPQLSPKEIHNLKAQLLDWLKEQTDLRQKKAKYRGLPKGLLYFIGGIVSGSLVVLAFNFL